MEVTKIDKMIGLVPEKVIINENNTEMVFQFTNGLSLRFYHEQDCCESVSIDDIVGDTKDLIGNEITMSEEAMQRGYDDNDYDRDSYTWTFYKFATVKGYVNVKWEGRSNGYYSEAVDMEWF